MPLASREQWHRTVSPSLFWRRGGWCSPRCWGRGRGLQPRASTANIEWRIQMSISNTKDSHDSG
eukprot:223730-Rhodomonas_salina.3